MDYRNEFELELQAMSWNMRLAAENKEIFANYDLNSLSSREKRKIIFDYLVNKSSYDDILFENIRSRKRGKVIDELTKYAETKNGVCHTISEYYKMLLGYNNIYSLCVCCMQQLKNAPSEGHMLNLVYDDITGEYSFDDITMTILERDSFKDILFEHDKYFNYNLQVASRYGQGNEDVIPGRGFYPMNLTSKYSFYKYKANSDYLKYRLEKPDGSEPIMPRNINSFNNEPVNKK